MKDGGNVAFTSKYGDSHNFGRRVSVFKDPVGNVRVEKPRTIYWEYFFLDGSSPLRQVLRDIADSLDFDAILGNIKIEMSENCKDGVAEFYEEPPVESFVATSEWFRNYGRILAFCSILGITDLHIENALLSSKGVQIVDIESVFWDTLVPSETLLLPRTPLHVSRNILSKVGLSDLRAFKSATVGDILIGSAEVFSFFFSNLNQLLIKLSQFSELFAQHPIRFLLRDTRDYSLDLNFYPEEIVQLTRKDIPYFFGYILNSEAFYYYEEPERQRPFLSLDQEVSKKIQKSFCPFDVLLDSQRLHKLESNLMAEVVDKLWIETENSIDASGLSVKRDADFISIKTNRSYFKVKAR